MTRYSRTRAVIVMLAALVLLAGCASRGIGIDQSPGAPPGVGPPGVSPPVGTDPGPTATIDDDGNLVLVTYGSSSCPPTPTNVEAPDAGTVVIDLDPSTRGHCTADIAPTTHIIPLPDLAAQRPLTIQLNYVGQPGHYTITAG